MFPARAGMSRPPLSTREIMTNVPRASGDEPLKQLNFFGAA